VNHRNDHDDAVLRRPETKSFILTSEFWVAAAAAAAVLFAAYVLDDISETTGWRFATWIAIAYVVSRGIAKAGSQRAYQPDPRHDDVDLREREPRRGEAQYRDSVDSDPDYGTNAPSRSDGPQAR